MSIEAEWGPQEYGIVTLQGGRPMYYRGAPVGLPGFPPGSVYRNAFVARSQSSTEAIIVTGVLAPGTSAQVQVSFRIVTDGVGNVLSETELARVGAPMAGVLGTVSALVDGAMTPSGRLPMIVASFGPQQGQSRTTFLIDGVPQFSSGDPSPVPGTTWESLNMCALNDRGDWALTGRITGAEWIVVDNGVVVFRESQLPPILAPHGVHAMSALQVSSRGILTWWMQTDTQIFGQNTATFVDGELFMMGGYTVLDGEVTLGPGSTFCQVDADGVYMGTVTGYQTPNGLNRIALVLPLDQSRDICVGPTNSTGRPATLGAHGSPWVSDGTDVELLGNGLPGGSFALMLASLTSGSTQNPGGAFGTLCLGGAILRSNALPVSEFGAARTQLSTMLGVAAAPAAGETWYFQAWYRDVQAGASVSRLSAAVEMEFF